VALCALVLYPELSADPDTAKLGYVAAMKDFLPDGLRGLLLVAFLAAYMSTISTQLNWGASYIVNDFVKPLLDSPDSGKDDQANLVLISRIVTGILMVVAFLVTSQLNSISGVWSFMMECGAGLGLVLILRWFWWRINVWSEIAATVTPFIIYGGLKLFFAENDPIAIFPNSYFITIGGTTLVWIIVTLITPAEKEGVLDRFYAKVRPGGFWGPSRIRTGVVNYKSNTWPLIGSWLSAVVMTYSTLFATGKLIFRDYDAGFTFLAMAIVAGVSLVLLVKRYKLFSDDGGR
jgi:Na+/proline symporter